MIKCITDTTSLRLINCNTLEITYFDDISVECDDILETLWVIDHISKGRSLRHLVVINEFTLFSIEAKQLLAEENIKRKSKIVGEAIVVRSIATRLLENFYKQQIDKYYPVKLFDNTLEAKKWLENPELSINKLNIIV